MGVSDPGTTSATAPWPLVGRSEELAFILGAWRDHPPKSIVLTGIAGVGKTRLAARALEEAVSDPRWVSLTVTVSAGLARLPFGAIRTALDVGVAYTALEELADAVDAAARGLRGDKRFLICIDDAHRLDDESAGTLHQWASRGEATLIATVRAGSGCPAAVTALWKDGLAHRLELQDLALDDIVELIQTTLGSDVEESTVERLWTVTRGNPLYLREVMAASRETGALADVDGRWRWRGAWQQADRLREIVAERLGQLDAEELTLIETLAVGGSVPLDLLAELSPTGGLVRLETRGLVAVKGPPDAPIASVAHPVHAEVVRARLPLMSVRSICRNLADAASRRRVPLGSATQILVARWSVEAGIPVDPVTLRQAANSTLWHVGVAIADRIQEILPGIAGRAPLSAAGAEAPTQELVARLAIRAWEEERTTSAGAQLAVALVWMGEVGRAEEILQNLANEVSGADDRLRVSIALGHLRFWGQYRAEEAVEVLRQATGLEGDPGLSAQALEGWAGIELNIGHPARALELSGRCADCLGTELAEAISAPPAAAALTMLGRSTECIELVNRALPHALANQEKPLAAAQLLLARIGALGYMGRLAESLQEAEACRQLSIDVDSLDGTAIFGLFAGDVLLLQGRPASATRRYRDAAGLLAERDVLGYRAWALAGMAQALALLGDAESAAELLATAETCSPCPRYFDGRLHRARSAIAAAEGRVPDAIGAGLAAADWAASSSMPVDEALALDAVVQLQPSSEALERLHSLAGRADGELISLLASRSAALAHRDTDGLLDSANQLGTIGANLMAAESAAHASSILKERNREREAKSAARLARAWYDNCEQALSLPVQRLRLPAGLTRRELEVARLVALGLSHKDIAERLHVSTRTVEAHVYRTYTKLGVNSRSGLVDALALSGSR